LNTFIIYKVEDIKKIIDKNNKFADIIGSNLLSHRLQTPLIWWKYFSSKDDVDFATKRGRNCLGYKSWTNKILYIITEKDGNLCGAALLFVSNVLLKGSREPIKVLSFCPDSVMIFYQDFLVHPNFRQETIASLFKCIEAIVKSENLLLFLGHIPASSPNIQYFRNEIALRQNCGWVGGETVNCGRGGVYPWNIPQLTKVLQALLNEISANSKLRSEIKVLRKLLEKQTSALLLFVKTRETLEKKVQDIIRNLSFDSKLNKYSKSLSGLLETTPIKYPYLNLPDNTDAFYSSLSKSKRYFYRRYLKKFLSAGGTFEKVSSENISMLDIKEYLSLHALRWKKESAAVNDQTMIFHEELCLQMAKSGYFQLFFAKYTDRRIAAISCFDIGSRREFYYSGRTLDNSKLRAGKLIVLYSILDAIEKGFKIYDFGYGGDEYKFDYTDNYKSLKSFFLAKDNMLPDLYKLFPMYEQIAFY
jgi:Acetyltransferase (GNAT) domain